MVSDQQQVVNAPKTRGVVQGRGFAPRSCCGFRSKVRCKDKANLGNIDPNSYYLYRMKTELFDYDLPTALIAQQPAEPRDSSRLLVLHRADGRIEHCTFRDIAAYLRAGDLLVANDSRVIPARLHGRKTTGGSVEIFLLRPIDDMSQQWLCLVRGRNLGEGVTILIEKTSDNPQSPNHPISQSPNLPISQSPNLPIT